MANSLSLNLVFMLEEESAKHVLDTLLPRIIPSNIANIEFLCIPHTGRSHLQKSIPYKLNGWRKPNSSFIILHDQDSYDCAELKNDLQKLCPPQSYIPLICIVCKELEAWYFGDLDAVQKAYPQSSAIKYRRKAKFRTPDEIHKPSEELKKIIKIDSKIKMAKSIPCHMDINKNTSPSFNYMLAGVKKIIANQPQQPNQQQSLDISS